jgi:hypothetical protein
MIALETPYYHIEATPHGPDLRCKDCGEVIHFSNQATEPSIIAAWNEHVLRCPALPQNISAAANDWPDDRAYSRND